MVSLGLIASALHQPAAAAPSSSSQDGCLSFSLSSPFSVPVLVPEQGVTPIGVVFDLSAVAQDIQGQEEAREEDEAE